MKVDKWREWKGRNGWNGRRGDPPRVGARWWKCEVGWSAGGRWEWRAKKDGQQVRPGPPDREPRVPGMRVAGVERGAGRDMESLLIWGFKARR